PPKVEADPAPEPRESRMETLTPKADPDEAAFPDLAPEPELIMIEPSSPVEETLQAPDIDVILPPGIRRPGLPVMTIAFGVTGLFVAAGIAAILLTRRPSKPETPQLAGPEGAEASPPP